MSITREEVEHIARLARLALTEEEIERFQRQLSDILTYASRLGELDTHHILPTGEAVTEPVLRPDEPTASLARETLLQLAPQVQDGQYRVPPALENPRDQSC